ncbi:ATP-binding protein [Aquisalinus flavus]|uniref:histidine kinase n=1 Tax=Aquisalinus flavus TaxID=1526572 RepID=A0A8J2Y7S9_9PROT|nr:ATP-binding protein [Aquisalinus flavus]MBD0428161.1 HAMP domain-containing protein [Aquisalinus flavus]UNE47773.1 HAMP domain-containing protein [Aquisalinus flavus]GGD05813.1 hypothetical protein GCM10011342_13420 [Aquisalinus flavus]
MIARWSQPMARIGRSLFARIFLITIIALISFVLIFFAAFRSTLIFPAAIESLAGPLSIIIQQSEDAAPGGESRILDLFASATRAAGIVEDFPGDATIRDDLRERLMTVSPETEAIFFSRDIRFRYVNARSKLKDLPIDMNARFAAVTALEISVELNDGRVLVVLFSPAAVIVDRPGLVGTLFAIASLIIGTIAAIGIHISLKPLNELERAAERFGVTFDPEPVIERGPEEIRRVARALNRTQDQVRGLISERARMISALAHDVLTSLTRLRLRAEGPAPIDQGAMAEDINLLEELIDDMLIYAKSGEPNHCVDLIDMLDFIKTYAQEAPSSIQLQINTSLQEYFIAADSKAIIRVLNNLIDNAFSYGGSARIVCESNEAGLAIHIDDDGPGIPEDELVKVLEPFYRLETSRNRRTGGSGMGLGIADTLLRAQGGHLTLQNKSPSGLRATLLFPAALEITS